MATTTRELGAFAADFQLEVSGNQSKASVAPWSEGRYGSKVRAWHQRLHQWLHGPRGDMDPLDAPESYKLEQNVLQVLASVFRECDEDGDGLLSHEALVGGLERVMSQKGSIGLKPGNLTEFFTQVWPSTAGGHHTKPDTLPSDGLMPFPMFVRFMLRLDVFEAQFDQGKVTDLLNSLTKRFMAFGPTDGNGTISKKVFIETLLRVKDMELNEEKLKEEFDAMLSGGKKEMNLVDFVFGMTK